MRSAEEERAYWDAVDPVADYERCIFDGPADHGLDRIRGLFNAGDTLFDLGCGTGRLALRLTRWFSVHAFDISPRMLQAARWAWHHNDDEAAWARYAFLALGTDGRCIPNDDETYEGGYSVLLFQHLEPETVQGYLREVARVLRPGGRFIFQFAYDPDGQDGPYAWNHSLNDVSAWALDAGLAKDSDVEHDDLYPTWYWLTVETAP